MYSSVMTVARLGQARIDCTQLADDSAGIGGTTLGETVFSRFSPRLQERPRAWPFPPENRAFDFRSALSSSQARYHMRLPVNRPNQLVKTSEKLSRMKRT